VAQSKWDAAEREFRAALSLRPAFQRARMNLGTVLGRTGRFDESLREFTQILPAETAHFNVGILCLQLQQYEKAEKSFEKALAINPECPGAGEYLMQLRRIAGLKPAAAAPAIIPAPAVQVLANQPILAGPAAVDPAQQP
jgi:Tfp pilus assembly protein PilF